jgi:hypothetical protein
MFEPKVIAIGAAVGFGLSFLVGLLSGASFVMVLFRAVVMGIFAGGFLFAVQFAISRFLPELNETPARVSDEGQAVGQAVNITIDGNEPDRDIFSGPEAQNIGEMVPDFLSGANEAELSPAATAASDAFVPTYGARSMGSVEKGTASLGATKAPKGIAGDAQSERKSTIDGLDVLPDIQDFVPESRDSDGESDEGEAGPATVSGFGSGSETRSGFSDAGEKLSGIESETMAKAIRTILTREG